MANELIESLKKIDDDKKLEKKLCELLKAKKLKTKDLITASEVKKKPLIIPPTILNKIGDNFFNGKNEFQENDEFAVELYELAVKQNDDNPESYYNLAWCKCFERGTTIDLKNAEKYCRKAIQLGIKNDNSIYLMGIILWRQKKWKDAADQFIQFIKSDDPDKDHSSKAQYYLGLFYSEKIETPNLKKALAYLKNVHTESDFYKKAQAKIKLLSYLKEIDDIFKSIPKEIEEDSSEETGKKPVKKVVAFKEDEQKSQSSVKTLKKIPDKKDEQNSEEPFKPLKKNGWYAISPLLHGHDPNEDDNIITEYELASINFDIAKSASEIATQRKKELPEKDLPQSTKKAVKKTLLEIEKTSLSNAEKKRDEAEEKYDDLMNSATIKHYERQRKVEETYFAPVKTLANDSKKFAQSIQKHRLATSQDKIETIDVSSQPTRRLITAELGVISVGIKHNNKSSGTDKNYGWSTNQNTTTNGKYKTFTYCYDETISLGCSKFSYRQDNNPNLDHPGNYYMYGLGEYSAIMDFINKITDSGNEINIVKEKKLANYMLRYSQSGTPMTLDELKKLYMEATDNDLLKIHRIFYHCFVKEPSRFFLAKQTDHQLPLASANARALQLLVRGHLTMEDVFSQDAPYGVFTAEGVKDDISALKIKIDRINEKYEQQILNINSAHADNYYAFMHHHPQAKVIPTRQQFRKELQEVYGGESDSNGEGYSTDDEFTLKM